MVSFFEKLKKGMGIEEQIEEIEEEKERAQKTPEKKSAPFKNEIKKAVKPKKSASSPDAPKRRKEKKPEKVLVEEKLTPEIKKIEIKAMPIETKQEAEEKLPPLRMESEGELAVDVYQTENDLVIQSAVAGVNPDALDVVIEKDLVTINGSRKKPSDEDGDYFTRECFWGPFKREIILPVEVDPGHAQATMKEGVLVIRLPKILRDKKRKIAVKG